jgi:threonine synthase
VTAYISTRGGAPKVAFREALLAGLAPDGGLYLPEQWPEFGRTDFEAFAEQDFAEVAGAVLGAFAAPWINREEATALAREAYQSFLEPRVVAPLVALSPDHYLLELFHGPTLAFKDVAMQLLARLFERALGETCERVTIVGATSGDTGGAAVAAFAGRPHIDLFVLYPEGRISPVQRRFMTTSSAANVRAIAVDGTFDDCQRLVKALFADRLFVARRKLSGINSINWARLVIQATYYFTAAARLARSGELRPPVFSVPTGNFGDAFAGYVAKRLGLSAGPILCAVNANDIIHRVLSTGRYQPRRVIETAAPSMDIEVASNFERLLFEASGRDAIAVNDLMRRLNTDGFYEVPASWRAAMAGQFLSGSVGEADRVTEMRASLEESGKVLDPHTAIAAAAARRFLVARAGAAPVITLATAHPAKFPEAIRRALGRDAPLPGAIEKALSGPEMKTDAPADPAAVKAIIDAALG